MMGNAELCVLAVFYGGSHIDDACKQACDLSKKMNACVMFTFNGSVLLADPSTDAMALSTLFMQRVRQGDYGGIISVRAAV